MKLIVLLLALVSMPTKIWAVDDYSGAAAIGPSYIFAWPDMPVIDMIPRGGTTQGAAIALDTAQPKSWLDLQNNPKLSDFERDRLAILSMVGQFRASFDFLETVGFVDNYQPSRPYRSWGTEFVKVIEDSGTFISLQHIMVLYILDAEGSESAPIVMKHWRQDWHYQDRETFTFTGDRRWVKRTHDAKRVANRWSQAVYQVDDSPRYQAHGKWDHRLGYSSWQSDETWRPLPRRESSARADYDVLMGTNRHTITPSGWVQEEENLKVALAPQKGGNSSDRRQTVVAKEIGIARYQRIIDHDWTPGEQYWLDSGAYWAVVRQNWRSLVAKHQDLTIRSKIDGMPMFMDLFNQQASMGAIIDRDEQRLIVDTINAYLSPP